ncbi:MAG: MFS transporter [Bdellovibrionales bacterium]|nr:MFS transporter [Bdellovibrionales bacterium]
MKYGERRTVLSLALLYAMRMLGLFMILPVLSLLGRSLEGANGFLIGLAMGSYGLSQALLQVPYGFLSDRFGRKKMLVIGLLIFAAGSAVAALSESIYGVIAGRFLQGAGAIASVLMALLSDLTTEENRTKAMAVIGMSIGVSFSVALVVGPVISGWAGLSGLFWLTAGMAFVGILIVVYVIPTPVTRTQSRDALPVTSLMWEAISHPELRRLDVGVFALHMSLTALFVVVPLSLVNQFHLVKSEHWWIYLSVMGTSFFAMIPFIVIAEKKRKMKPVFLGAIALASLSCLSLLVMDKSLTEFWVGLFFFFMAFNLLEASLPSLVSKIAPAGGKGTAMGIYSSSQFFGAFVGGAAGGAIFHKFGTPYVFGLCGGMLALWFMYAATMKAPSYATSLMVRLSSSSDKLDPEHLSSELLAIYGVEDVVVILEEHVAYLKVDKAKFKLEEIHHYPPFASGKCFVGEPA